MQKVQVPDIGDYKNVPVIEILVNVGDKVAREQSLITLESDKATMEVPSPVAGVVKNILVKLGDKISQGSEILIIEENENAAIKTATSTVNAPTENQPTPLQSEITNNYDCDVLILGAGPGGYTAAFRAADLGQKVILVEKHKTLGGVCLNVGCIPSKALLHIAGVINETRSASHHGVEFGEPKIDIDKIRLWKESVINKLTTGLAGLAKQRKVKIIHGEGKFVGANEILITDNNNTTQKVLFKNAIIAVGSSSVKIPSFPEDPRIFSSTGALQLAEIPKTLLVIGGGIIGLEMATVYATLGANVTVVELMAGIMPGADRDLVKPMQKKLESIVATDNKGNITQKINIKTAVKVTNIKVEKKGLVVSFSPASGDAVIPEQIFDKILLSVGRRPNGRLIDADKAGVNVDERGFIKVDGQMRTNINNIFAIGDVVGEPMLAHKATHQGKVAAEVIAGEKSFFQPQTIPAVAYTDPEVAWVGLTETQAREQGINFEKGVFPWLASGRALSMAREEGLTKIIYDKETHRVLGGGIVGKNAGELIGELCLAVEMNADISDLALTIHPHPTLCETVGFAAEVAEGTITDIYAPKKK